MAAIACLIVSAGPPGCATGDGAPQPVYRTKELLDLQNNEPARATAPMTGPETAKVLENYQRSIGKGGAGASLPPPVTSDR